MTNKLAWIVTLEADDPQDQASCVVFAPDDESSILLGWPRLGAEGPEACSTARSPEFDPWSGKGEVPPLVLLQHGWRFECHGCGASLPDDDDEDDGCLDSTVEHGRFVYCSEACRSSQIAEIMRVNASFEEFQQAVKQKWPGLVFVGFDGGWPILTPIARFTFPGSLYGGGRVRMDQEGRLEVAVASGDISAWERYCSQGCTKTPDEGAGP